MANSVPSSRFRNFATIIYPDSAPEDWRSVLSDHHIPAFISPLHDSDENPTGERKKPHYHVILMFEGKKSIEQINEIMRSFGGVGEAEVVKSLRAYARYLCHLDNPDKHQYSTDDVQSLSGADYYSIIGLAVDKYVALRDMEEFCDRYNIVSFYLLARYASKNRHDWDRILKDSGAIYMREFLESRRWSIDRGHTQIVDPETGEILL